MVLCHEIRALFRLKKDLQGHRVQPFTLPMSLRAISTHFLNTSRDLAGLNQFAQYCYWPVTITKRWTTRYHKKTECYLIPSSVFSGQLYKTLLQNIQSCLGNLKMYLLHRVQGIWKDKFLDCLNVSYDTNQAPKRSERKKRKKS